MQSKEQKLSFSYQPADLIEFSQNIREKKKNYLFKRRFASLFDLNRLMDCLKNSTPEQLQRFKGAIWAVYDLNKVKDFFAEDKESLIKMKKRVDALKEHESISDAVVLHQLREISENLGKIIERL